MLASLLALRYRQLMLIAIANTKGGVGKSTLAVHLAVWLFDQGFSVGLLDADKQRSSSQWTGEAEPEIENLVTDTPEDCLKKARGLTKSCDFVIADGPAGLDDLSRTLLILADIAVLPITPSILDLRSVEQATAILKYAQGINRGRPQGRLVLNKIRTRETISRELRKVAPKLGLPVTKQAVRDLQAYRDAAQQASVVTRMGRRAAPAARDIDALFSELLRGKLGRRRKTSGRKRVANG